MNESQQPDNPYAAPATELADRQQGPVVPLGFNGMPDPAGKWVRFATFLIDSIVGVFGIAIVMIALLVVLAPEEWTNTESGLPPFLDAMPDFVIGIIFTCVYYVPTEMIWGRTLGKLIMGTRVVNEDGGKPSFGQVVSRSLCRNIPFEPFSFLGETGRGWHDSISKTYVVKCR